MIDFSFWNWRNVPGRWLIVDWDWRRLPWRGTTVVRPRVLGTRYYPLLPVLGSCTPRNKFHATIIYTCLRHFWCIIHLPYDEAPVGLWYPQSSSWRCNQKPTLFPEVLSRYYVCQFAVEWVVSTSSTRTNRITTAPITAPTHLAWNNGSNLTAAISLGLVGTNECAGASLWNGHGTSQS